MIKEVELNYTEIFRISEVDQELKSLLEEYTVNEDLGNTKVLLKE